MELKVMECELAVFVKLSDFPTEKLVSVEQKRKNVKRTENDENQ